MLFTTGRFLLLFLPITLALFFLLGRLQRKGFAAGLLVVASLYFYASWRPIHVWLLLASIGANYYFGGLIAKLRPTDARAAHNVMLCAVAANLATLGFFKYFDFVVGSVNSLLGTTVPLAHIALPLGISFFTFTQIAYLVDVARGKAIERSGLRYMLFVTYFPHLVAGPVLHHAQMMPQFRRREVYFPHAVHLAEGMAFIVIGMIKKVIVADGFAPTANAVFNAAEHGAVPSIAAWSGIIAYALQIYFDFSGYSDMAIGLSRLCNIQLPYNFNSPYKARSIIDFWRRWHMTLSAFLRDYLYIALGGNRRGPVRRYVNLLLTMLLGGLWHGASWTFVAWGGLHGLYLIINHGWHWTRQRLGLFPSPGRVARISGSAAGLALTLLAVLFAWIFFRASTFSGAARMIDALAMPSRMAHPVAQTLDLTWWSCAAAAILIALLLPNSQEIIDAAFSPRLDRLKPGRKAAVAGLIVGVSIVVAILAVLISQSRDVTEFIYFNF